MTTGERAEAHHRLPEPPLQAPDRMPAPARPRPLLCGAPPSTPLTARSEPSSPSGGPPPGTRPSRPRRPCPGGRRPARPATRARRPGRGRRRRRAGPPPDPTAATPDHRQRRRPDRTPGHGPSPRRVLPAIPGTPRRPAQPVVPLPPGGADPTGTARRPAAPGSGSSSRSTSGIMLRANSRSPVNAHRGRPQIAEVLQCQEGLAGEAPLPDVVLDESHAAEAAMPGTSTGRGHEVLPARGAGGRVGRLVIADRRREPRPGRRVAPPAAEPVDRVGVLPQLPARPRRVAILPVIPELEEPAPAQLLVRLVRPPALGLARRGERLADVQPVEPPVPPALADVAEARLHDLAEPHRLARPALSARGRRSSPGGRSRRRWWGRSRRTPASVG